MIKKLIAEMKMALETVKFHYNLRMDVKKYYTSIEHRLSLEQPNEQYANPRLRWYFTEIVITGVNCYAVVHLPTQGIPIRSSLSPFFGDLYLTALDQAFKKRPSVFYRRYQDDPTILCETKRQ